MIILSQLFTFPNRQLDLLLQNLDGRRSSDLRRDGILDRRKERSSLRSAPLSGAAPDNDEDPRPVPPLQPEDDDRKELLGKSSLYDQINVISFEYPQANQPSGKCIMPNAITNSKFVGQPDALYQRYVKYLNSLDGMFQIHGWGDHIVQTIGFAVVLRPLEIALNHSLVWNMTSLPYAHQHFVDCVAGDKCLWS